MPEHELYHGDRLICWSFNYNPAYEADGNIFGIPHNATDIKPLKQAEQQTLDRNLVPGRIALIHFPEICRPVSSIMGLTELLKMQDETKKLDEIEASNVVVK